MSVLSKVVRAGVGRRRVQTTVLTLTTLVAVTASVLSAGLLVAARTPFDHAFASRAGAHLSVQFDGSKTTAAQAAATAHAAGVTAATGPFPVAAGLQTAFGADCPTFSDGTPTDGAGQAVTVAARPVPDSTIDKLASYSGAWPSGPGEIALASWPRSCLGKTVVFPGLPGKPSFKVVGGYDSITRSAGGWVTPDGFARLTGGGSGAATATATTTATSTAATSTTVATPTDWQMLYQFADHDTDAEIAADRAAVVAAAPAGSVQGAQSYLDVKRDITGDINVFVPFLVVFGVLGLFLSVLIISIVVSGAVIASLRRIGILKALGFTPAQVVRAYVAQALIPATVGTVLGAVCANLLSGPVLKGGRSVLGMPDASIPLWVYLGLPALTLAIVIVTALVPALRAGRLSAVQALVAGRTPQATRGRAAQRLGARLPFPRPVSLGLVQPFARPARTITIAAAVVFGALSATFALGLEAGFSNFQQTRSQGISAGAVVVRPAPPAGEDGPRIIRREGTDTVADPSAVAAVIAAQPDTQAFFGYGRTQAVIPGAPDNAAVFTITGDMSWARYEMLSGRWFAAPGEAVVADRFASASGVHVGDTITVQDQGKAVPLKIVGIDFDTHMSGLGILTSDTTYTALGLKPPIDQFNVELKSGSAAQEFLAAANPALAPLAVESDPNSEGHGSSVVITMSALVGTLTLMLVAVAALGVLNTVVQDTRERVHELGVFKALGMTPRQTVTMVLTSVSMVGLPAGLIGVPLGVLVERAVMPAMGNAVGMHLPPTVTDVYTPALVVPLLAGGLVIALAGAFLPAGWAAKAETATALRSE